MPGRTVVAPCFTLLSNIAESTLDFLKFDFQTFTSSSFFYLFPFRGNQDWTLVSNSVKPGGNFVVLDLSPATWYNLRVTAHNNAGSTVAEYEFATLTLTGGKYKQAN